MTVTAVTRLEPIFEPVIEQAGFRLVRLRMMGAGQQTLQVMAERPDGSMDVEGCTQLSHALLDFIEANDPVPGEYEIEVSSPGIDRPLTRPMDFVRWSGHEAKIELTEMLKADPEYPNAKGNRADGKDVRFPFRSLANAKLVLTDKLIAEDLKARRSLGESQSDQKSVPNLGEV